VEQRHGAYNGAGRRLANVPPLYQKVERRRLPIGRCLKMLMVVE
jgi:hypothetical protein